MKKLHAVAVGTLLSVWLAVPWAGAAPQQVGWVSRVETRAAPLSISRVHVGMPRDEVHRLQAHPSDIKYDRSANVSFVVGDVLVDGHAVLHAGEMDDLEGRQAWGQPFVEGSCGSGYVTVYRMGTTLAIVRVRPTNTMDRRSAGVEEFIPVDRVTVFGRHLRGNFTSPNLANVDRPSTPGGLRPLS